MPSQPSRKSSGKDEDSSRILTEWLSRPFAALVGGVTWGIILAVLFVVRNPNVSAGWGHMLGITGASVLQGFQVTVMVAAGFCFGRFILRRLLPHQTHPWWAAGLGIAYLGCTFLVVWAWNRSPWLAGSALSLLLVGFVYVAHLHQYKLIVTCGLLFFAADLVNVWGGSIGTATARKLAVGLFGLIFACSMLIQAWRESAPDKRPKSKPKPRPAKRSPGSSGKPGSTKF